jgi:carbon monoxide dehydrogenase subunit G
MKVEQQFAVPFAREQVWALFRDIAAVVRCLPGAELGETGADGHIAGRFRVKLGPIAVAFAGEGVVRFDDNAFAGEISGAGADRGTGSRARGSVAFALVEAADGTRIDLAVDYTLAGALAQFGRGGIVQDLAARLTAEFADNLRRALASEAPPEAAAPIAGGRLLAGAVRDRVKRALRRPKGAGGS